MSRELLSKTAPWLCLVVTFVVVVLGTDRSSRPQSPTKRPVDIEFRLSLEGQPWSCADQASSSFDLVDFRMFVHDIELLDGAGNKHHLELEADGRWQTDTVALLDFADDRGACQTGSAGTSFHLRGNVAALSGDSTANSSGGGGRKEAPEELSKIRFRLGLPFEANHENPAIASSPLNVGQMHWSWQSGYKFVRFEANAQGELLRFHLGSTGCDGAVGAVKGCLAGNRAYVELTLDEPLQQGAGTNGLNRQGLDSSDPLQAVATLDATTLVRLLLPRPQKRESDEPRVESKDGKRQADGACLAEPADPDCKGLFALLRLDEAPRHGEASSILVSRLFERQPPS